MNTTTNAADKVWKAIDQEKQRDRMLKRVSVAAWSATLLLALLLAIVGGITTAQMVAAATSTTPHPIGGSLPWMSVLGAVLPVVVPLGALAALIAVLSTVAMFFRGRAATLHEIQLRLAALEDALAHPRERA